jgi:alpha-L-rhamnosidase
VRSDQSVLVEYGGRALASRQRADWNVRIWDRHGQPSAWSPTAYWEMGLLAPADWTASWIGLPAPAVPKGADAQVERAPARWIWYPEGDPRVSAPAETRCFGLAVDLPADRKVQAASWLLAADNAFEAAINGRPVGGLGAKWDWKRYTRLPVTEALRPGRNGLALAATNTGGPAGVAALLQVRFEDGGVLNVPTGREWKAAQQGESWASADLDDSAWVQAMDLGPVDGEEIWKTREWKSPDSPPATYLRKAFSLGKAVRRARAYASAKGLYVLYLNGRRVSEDVFRPGWTDYRDRIQYQTYDVTPLLRRGENAIGVVLGDGW